MNHEARAVPADGHGSRRRHYLRPASYRCSDLIAELADEWVRLAPELGSSCQEVRAAIVRAGTVFDRLPGADELALASLRRTHLDRLEEDLLDSQARTRTDTRYRNAVYLFALLRRIDEDRPGVLHADVADRVRMPTRLRHLRRPGDQPFTVWERRAMIAAAKRLANRDGRPGQDELIALHVLLLHATGEPVEVLRRVRTGDIAATPAPGAGSLPTGRHERWPTIEHLAAANQVASYRVRYTKTRSAIDYDDDYSTGDRLAHWAWTTLIQRTRDMRGADDSLWVYEDQSGAVRTIDWRHRACRLRCWTERHIPAASAENPMRPELSEPVIYRRFRKHVVAEEAMRNPARYFSEARRHSNQTFFDHYASSPVLRAQAGRIVVDAIGELFDAAAAGPTIVDPEATALLAQGAAPAGLDGVDITALVSGELNGPLAACRDPHDVPHDQAAAVCDAFANDRCYRCRNAIITQDHLPGVLRMTELLDPERFGRPDQWERIWGSTYRFLTEQVLPQFDDDAVDAAAAHVGDVYLDAGLEQELGTT